MSARSYGDSLLIHSTQDQPKIVSSVTNFHRDTAKCRYLNARIEALPDGEWEEFNDSLKQIAEAGLKRTPPNDLLYKVYQKYLAAAINNNAYILQDMGEFEESLKQYQESYKIRKEIDDKPGIIECLNNIASVYATELDNYDKAYEYYMYAISVCSASRDMNNLAYMYNEIATVQINKGRSKEAFSTLLKTYKTAVLAGDQGIQTKVLFHLGIYYENQGKWENAVNYYNKAILFAQHIGAKSTLGMIYNRLGNIYLQLNDTIQTRLNFKKGLEASQDLNDSRGIARALANLANLYRTQGHFQKSLAMFLESSNTIGEEDLILSTIINNDIAAIYFDLGETQKAFDYCNKNLSLCKKTNNKPGQSTAYHMIGECFLRWGNIHAASQNYLNALSVAQQFGYPKLVYKASLSLKNVYRDLRMFDKACEMQVISAALKDSLNQDEFKRNTLTQQFRNEFLQKEKELEINQRTETKMQAALLTQRQHYLIAALIIITLIAAFVVGLFYFRNKIRKEKAEKLLLLQIKDSEVKALQAQMNPHFIFNSLNSVLEFVRRSEKNEALKYLTKFSRLIRMILESSGKKLNSLAYEMELLTLYVDLENIRYGNNFQFTLACDPRVDPDIVEVPPLLAQPFIENAIIHGIQNREPSQISANLSVKFLSENGFLKCIIEDNGIGRKKAKEIEKRKGNNFDSLGIRISKERLNSVVRTSCNIEVTDLVSPSGEPTGTQVELTMLLVENV